MAALGDGRRGCGTWRDLGEMVAHGEILRHLERSDPQRMVADLMVGEGAALGEILENGGTWS